MIQQQIKFDPAPQKDKTVVAIVGNKTVKPLSSPTNDQIENCAGMGWVYKGDCIFEKGNMIGWFEGRYFVKA